MAKILVVEDEPEMLDAIVHSLLNWKRNSGSSWLPLPDGKIDRNIFLFGIDPGAQANFGQ